MLNLPTPPRAMFGGLFVSSAVIILVVTGLAKVWAGMSYTKVLAVADPITGIQFGHLMLAVGVVELLIASICLFAKSHTLKLGLIAWLATNFVVYRLGLWWIGWKKPCGCLGNLTDALHLKPEVADNLTKVILAYLLLGSYGLLIWRYRCSRIIANEGKNSLGKAIVTVFLVSLSTISVDAQGWVFSGTLKQIQFDSDGKPKLTNTVSCSGIRDESGFAYHVGPTLDKYSLVTTVEWDGSMLRCLEVLTNAGEKFGGKNVLTNGCDARPFVDSVPVPRLASRQCQALAIALVSYPAFKRYFCSLSNDVFIELDLEIPEAFSTAELQSNLEHINSIGWARARAPNFLWDIRSGSKVRYFMPSPLTNGFVHWAWRGTGYDKSSGFCNQFAFTNNYYSADAVSGGQLEYPISVVFGDLKYTHASNPVDRTWMQLPRTGLLVADLRTSRNLEKLPQTTSITAMHFRAKDINWNLHPENAVAVQSQVASMLADNATATKNTNLRRFVILSLAACSTLAFIAALCRRGSHMKRS